MIQMNTAYITHNNGTQNYDDSLGEPEVISMKVRKKEMKVSVQVKPMNCVVTLVLAN